VPRDNARSPWSPLVTGTTALSSTTSQITTPSLLTILAQAAATATQTANTTELSEIDNQIQNRLNAQIAALQPATDPAVSNVLQSQITALQNQQATITALQPQYGQNVNMLSDLQTRLANLQTDVSTGDSADFDANLAAANTDVGNLVAVDAPAPFQPDQIAGLLGTGLGIGSSASYDLSTPTGQEAAAQAVQNAQNTVGEIFQATGANQLLAGDLTNSLNTQINTLTAQQQQTQQTSTADSEAQVQHLTQLAQNQEHLIELSLGSTSTIANVIQEVDNPPQPITSPFQALQEAVGATPSTYSSQQSTPAILSLLA
jgi:hypothetical protein